MSVNSKMTAIADAARALDGSAAALTLDGIAGKLATEKTNVAAALAAIAEKGVDVPAGSNSAALASLIAAIEAGGGGLKIATGTFTPTEDILIDDNGKAFDTTHVIEHGLGTRPNYYFLRSFYNRGLNKAYEFMAGCMYPEMNYYDSIQTYFTTWGYANQQNASYTSITPRMYREAGGSFMGIITDTTVPYLVHGKALYRAGKTYEWVVIGGMTE